MNKDKPKEMTIANCMKEMTSKESTETAIRELIEYHVDGALKAGNERRKKQDWIDNHINLKEHACTKAIINAYPKTNVV